MRRWGLLLACALALGCQTSPTDHIQKAKDALFQRQPKKALREYQLALDALGTPDTAEARVVQAAALKGMADVQYLQLHDLREAVHDYKKLVEACPESPEALEGRIRLADILADDVHDERGAITELTAALARNPPQSARLHYRVAKLYFQLDDYRQAALESAALVKNYEASRFVDDAMFLQAQAVSMIPGRRADAEHLFEELVDRFPHSDLAPHALFELGKLYAGAGRYDRAIDVWVKALARHPNPALVQAAIARARKEITEKHAEVGAKAAFARPKRIARKQLRPAVK